MTEEQKELLDSTAAAYNSLMVMNKLRDAIRNTKSGTSVQIANKSYSNAKINAIYMELIKRIPQGSFWEEVVETICDHMDQFGFEHQASVNFIDKYDYTRMVQQTSKNKADHYLDISLLDHTYNIVKVFLKEEAKEYIQEKGAFVVLLACVLHDFGKSVRLQSFLYKDDMSQRLKDHVIGSAKYLHYIKNGIYEKYQLPIETNQLYKDSVVLLMAVNKGVKNHHSANMENSIEYVISYLDKKTRAYEWEIYMDENPNKLDALITKGDNNG